MNILRIIQNLLFVALSFGVLFSASAYAAEAPAPEEGAARLLKAAKEGDTFLIVEELDRVGNVGEAANTWSLLVDKAYQSEKNVVLMNQIGRCGLQFLLSKAGAAEKGLREKLLAAARGLSYNLAANNWPGWGEAGITCDASTLAEGLDFARLHMRLVLALKEDEDKQANAHWVVGAILLAQKKFDASRKEFALAADQFTLAKKDDFHWMAVGYDGLAAKLAAAPGAEKYDEALKALEKLKTDDAREFRQQLAKALEVFKTR